MRSSEPSTSHSAPRWKRFGLLVNLDAIQDVRDADASATDGLAPVSDGASSAPGGLRTCHALVIGPEYQPLGKGAEEAVEPLKGISRA